MIRDNAEFRAQQVFVKVYVLYKGDNDYTYLGEGFFEIVTDQLIKFQRYQHYVEVSDKATNSIFLRSRLQKMIEYERQKSTIITWTDPEIDEDNIIGVTFEDESTCDMYWRLLCCKIGKSYLEINGKEKLQMPNQKNVRQLLEKIKTSFNLVAYHIINSKDFMSAFWQTLQRINKKDAHDEPMGLKVLRQLMYHYDPKIMAIILSDPNFYHYLQIYQFQCNVSYYQCYKKCTTINQLIQLNQKAKNSIELATRARFVKQCVISYEKDLMSSHMLDQVIKQNETEALIVTLNNNCIERLVQIYQNSKKSQKEQQEKILTKILTFILEAIWIIKIYHVDNTKAMFMNEFYTKGMFSIMAQILNIRFYKALEILTCISQFDPTLFLTELTNDYRSNSGNSILRVIGKYYSQGSQQYITMTIHFLKSITKPLLESKSNFELINKTFTFIVFTCCKKIEKIIPLLTFYIVDLGYLRSTIELLEKYKYFQQLKKLIAEKRISKRSVMDIIKLLKYIVEQNRPVDLSQEQHEKRQRIKNTVQKTKETHQIIKKLSLICLDSLLLKQLLEYFETNLQVNNMITSSIMQLIITIGSLPFNEFTRYIQKYDHGKLKKCLVMQRHLQRIMNIKEQKEEEQSSLIQMGGRKKVHRSLLESQMQEQYLQNDTQGGKIEQISISIKSERQIQQEIRKLQEIKSQINQRSRREEEEKVMKKRQLSLAIDKILAQKKKEEQLELGFDWVDQF